MANARTRAHQSSVACFHSAPGRPRVPAKRATRSPGLRRCRAKFLHYFPKGFFDPTYLDWERGYKWTAHRRWQGDLEIDVFRAMLDKGQFLGIASRAIAIESRTNLLFSFEKMALRDAVKSEEGARAFAHGLFEFLHNKEDMETRFSRWCEVVMALPRRQTRVLTWPLVTVFGFIAQPALHMFLKPNVMRRGFERYGLTFDYRSRPNWASYRDLLKAARTIRRDLASMRPRDLIDIQSFLWVQGSDEYPH